MLETFLDYLVHSRKYSENTVVAYKKDIEQFQEYLSAQYELNVVDAKRDMLRSWVVVLMEQKTAASSVSRKLASLSSYFKFLQLQGLVKSNPVKLVAKPKRKKALPQFLDSKASTQLFETSAFSNDIWGAQDKLILEMFFGTGMRLSELIGLQVAYVDLHKSQLRVLGKRNKERIIPLTNNLSEQIAVFLEYRKSEGADHLPYLYFTKKMKKLYPKFVYRLVNTYLQKVTTISKKSPHVLRHTFATQMLNQGADLNAIKEILGHTNLTATQVYTHNTIEKNKEVLKRSHPRG